MHNWIENHVTGSFCVTTGRLGVQSLLYGSLVGISNLMLTSHYVSLRYFVISTKYIKFVVLDRVDNISEMSDIWKEIAFLSYQEVLNYENGEKYCTHNSDKNQENTLMWFLARKATDLFDKVGGSI